MQLRRPAMSRDPTAAPSFTSMGRTRRPCTRSRSTSPGLGAPEPGLGSNHSVGGGRDQLLDHETLERGAPSRPGGQVGRLPQASKEVQQAGVTQVDLGALRQALLDVGVVGAQAPDHERLLEHVEVTVHRVRRNPERAGQIRDVQQVAVDVREHGPQRPQPGGGEAQPIRGEVPFEEGGDVGIEPVQSGSLRPTFEHRRVSAPEPAGPSQRLPRQLDRPKRGQLQEPDPSRQRFGDGSDQGGAGRAGEHVPSGPPARVHGVAQRREQLREDLCFIDGEPSGVIPEEAFEIGLQDAQVRRPLEVDVGPGGADGLHQRALPALPRAVDENNGNSRSRLRRRSVDARGRYFMTLYF